MLTYAGYSLVPTTPEVEEWVAHTLGPESDANWPGYQPGRGVQLRDRGRRAAPGRLSWPSTASRWAVGQYVVDGDTLDLIREAAYSDGYQALTFRLGDGPTVAVETDLWVMPARPLAVRPGRKQMYLITLVDDRYWWHRKAAQITVTGGSTTWADLISDIGDALGVEIEVDDIPAAYLKPDPSFSSNYDDLPALLDRVAEAIGMRVVRLFDGTVKVESFDTAASTVAANLALGLPVLAGGRYALAADDEELDAALPASVTVAFPASGGGAPGTGEFVVTVTLASLALDEVGDRTGGPGTKVFKSSALARYGGGPDPLNQTELTALAQQVARDWYKWQTAREGWVLDGVAAWTPEALGDTVVWEYRTRMVRTVLHRQVRSCCQDPPVAGGDFPAWGTYGSQPSGSAAFQTSPVQSFSASTVSSFTSPSLYQTVLLSTSNTSGTTITSLKVTRGQTFVNVGTNPITITNVVLVDGTGSTIQTFTANVVTGPGGDYSTFTANVVNGAVYVTRQSSLTTATPYTVSGSTQTNLVLNPPYNPVTISSSTSGGTVITNLKVPVWLTQQLQITITGSNPVTIGNVLTVDPTGATVATTSVNLYVPPGQTTFSTFFIIILPNGTVYTSPTPVLSLLQTAVQTIASTVNAFQSPPGNISQVQTQAGGSTVNGIIAPPGNSSPLTIQNTGPSNLTVANNSGFATGANRIFTSTGSAITVPAGSSLTLYYDTTQSVWVDTGMALKTVLQSTPPSVIAVVPAAGQGVSPSSVTVSAGGTFTFSWSNQSANLFFASPNGSTGAPSFRAIVAADLGSGASNTKFLRGDMTWQTVSGSGVPGGSSGDVQFNDGSSGFAGSAAFNWNDVAERLIVNHGSGTFVATLGGSSQAGLFDDGNRQAYLATGAEAGHFTDGTQHVTLANGTYAVHASTGFINSPGTTNNTYRWNANTSAPGTNSGTPTTRYGGDTNYLGDPDSWVLININGTDYKLPAFL